MPDLTEKLTKSRFAFALLCNAALSASHLLQSHTHSAVAQPALVLYDGWRAAVYRNRATSGRQHQKGCNQLSPQHVSLCPMSAGLSSGLIIPSSRFTQLQRRADRQVLSDAVGEEFSFFKYRFTYMLEVFQMIGNKM